MTREGSWPRSSSVCRASAVHRPLQYPPARLCPAVSASTARSRTSRSGSAPLLPRPATAHPVQYSTLNFTSSYTTEIRQFILNDPLHSFTRYPQIQLGFAITDLDLNGFTRRLLTDSAHTVFSLLPPCLCTHLHL